MPADRLAKCGHLAPYISGPQKRVCPMCAAPKQRVCKRCSTDITHRHPTAIYCSTRCLEIARGNQRALPVPPRVCALPKCTVAFQPRHDRQRCCCWTHGHRLLVREAHARARADKQLPGPQAHQPPGLARADRST